MFVACPDEYDQGNEADATAASGTRKRKRSTENWKRRQRKNQRNKGQEYVNKRGRLVETRQLQPSKCRCKLKCVLRIGDEKRASLFMHYWNELGTYQRHQDYLVNHIEVGETARKCAIAGRVSRRTKSARYFLTVDGVREKVCRDFFLCTLGETVDTIRYNRDHKRNNTGGSDAGDKRGKHQHQKKVDVAAKEFIRDHIRSYPAVESHYCRSRTRRRYLPQGLTVKEMYRQYVEVCAEKHESAQSEYIYRTVFSNDFNYGFHQPKKDQCTFCNRYKHATAAQQCELRDDYNLHMLRKVQARTKKEEAKQSAITNSKHCAITFDLQKVLLCPAGKVGLIFYKRKLASYNLTIHNLATREGHCFMWCETVAKRGSCEISSCLFKYFESLPETVENVTLISDSCSGQNRNVQVASMLMSAVELLPIKVIDYYFLESGHTQMEVDSIHACIERTAKSVDVYVPRDWALVAATAKKTGKPYSVKQLTADDIVDWKCVASKLFLNRNKTDDGGKLNWTKLKWIHFEKGSMLMLSKTEIDNSEFRTLKVLGKLKRGRPVQVSIRESMKRLYKVPVAISKEKYKDLMDLCKSKVIPDEYHPFYKNLKSAMNVADALDEPDVEEDSEQDDSGDE